MTALLALPFVFLGVSARAECAPQPVRVVAGTRAYVGRLDARRCFVSVSPARTPDLKYRAYVFNDDGLLMVFGSYGGGEGARLTSAREFYFFPRRAPAELLIDEAAPRVAVRMPNGDLLGFDPATAQVRSSERGEIATSPGADPAERGGVEFPGYPGLVLDAGFAEGRSPSARPDAESVFRSAHGQLCAVKNREVFAYSSNGDRSFNFDDAALSAWLKVRCPGLHAGF